MIFSEALAIKKNMFFRKDDYDELSDFSELVDLMALMAHECCHIWQYQNKINKYHWLKALGEHWKYNKSNVYKYKPIDPAKALADYRFEQQGAIIGDYYKRKVIGDPVDDYERVIYRSVEK